MISFLKLIRYKNLLMVLLTMVLTKYSLIHNFINFAYLSEIEFSILVISVLLITAGGYIINDIYDVKADKINKPNKVFINVSISNKNAWKSYFLLTFLGLFSGIYLSIHILKPKYSLIFISSALVLYFYSLFLKKVVFVGNLIVSILIILSILIVYIFDNSFDSIELFKVIFCYLVFSFLTTLIRELIKDIEDINGDLKIKAKTLPILFGRKRASKVAFFFSSILLIFLLIVIQYTKNEFLFLIYEIIFILIPLLYFMYKLWISETKKDFSKLSNLLKIIMLFGILSMLLFKFI